jgi:hypothetical protein
MLHGNHGNCRRTPTSIDDACSESVDHECPDAGWLTTPNAEGMVYLAETLAAQGYVAVTISGNAVNCRDDYIPERAQLVVTHLRRWLTWNATGGAPFGDTFRGHVDLREIGLVGHSRGGEAVAMVPSVLAASPVSGIRLGSVFSIAPTDYHDPRPSGVPYAVLLPACDGDVSTLEGMDIYDRALSTSDAHPRAQVFIDGANHNYFSTEWRNDDNGDGRVCATSVEIGGVAQQAMLETALSSWFQSTIRDWPVEPFVRADSGVPPGIDAWAGRALDLRWSYSSPSRVQIDEFNASGTPGRNLLGGANTFAGWYMYNQCFENGCDTRFDHDKGAIKLLWDGMTPIATLGLATLDASAYDTFSFRVVSRYSTLNTGRTEQEFTMRLRDGSGHQAEMLLSEIRRIEHLYSGNLALEVLQTVRIPWSTVREIEPAFDVSSLSAFEVEMTVAGNTRGSVLVTDVEIAD